MNYNKTVSACRESARDILRLQQVNMLRDTLLGLTSRRSTLLKKQEAHDESVRLNLKRLNFRLAQVLDADPDAEAKRESLNKEITAATEAAPLHGEQVTKLIADLDKMVEVVNEDIAKVQSGEFKVDKTRMSQIAEELCSKLVAEGACFEDVEAPEADPDAGVVSDES